MIRKQRLLASAAVGLALTAPSLSTAAVAQDADTEDFTLEEIIVTARKKAESLLDAPIAITAFGETELLEGGFNSILDVAKATPGLFIEKNNQTFARVNSTPRFRGIFLATGSRLQQTATVFLDGISMQGGIETIGINELQRVEIIKGPQSALFGRNTFSGAINYITKDPGEEFKGDIQVTAATRGDYRVAAGLEGPITDTLSYRIGGMWNSFDGHYDNFAVPGQRMGDESQWNVNATLFWNPSDSARIKIRGSYREVHDGVAAATNGAFGPLEHNFGGFAVNPDRSVDQSDSVIPSSNQATVRTNSFFRGTISGEGIPLSEIGNNSGPDDVITFRNALTSDGRFNDNLAILDYKYNPFNQDEFGLDLDEFRVSANGVFDLNENITMTLLGGFSRERYGFFSDFDVTPDQSFLAYQTQELDDVSLEGRLEGTLFNDKLSWAVGASYVDIDIEGNNATVNLFAFPLVFGAAFQDFRNSSGATTTGIFGSLEYALSDEITLIAEGRYQEDEIRDDNINRDVPGLSPATLENFLPRLTARYEPSENTTIYFTYSEGNLPGGFNPQVGELTPDQLAEFRVNNPDANTTFDEETLKNYELGWKQKLAGGRAAFNAAAFYMQRGDEIFRSLDVVTAVPGAPNPTRTVAFNGNGATTDIYGIEVDGSWLVTEELTLSGSIAYIDAKIDSFPEGGGLGRFGLVFGVNADISGQVAPRFPPFAASITANYEKDLENDWAGFDRWFVRGDWFHTGNYWLSNANLSEVEVANDVNLRIGLRGETVGVELFVTNLFEEDAPAAANTFANLSFDTRTAPGGFFNFNSIGSTLALRNKRQFGIRMNYSF